MALVACYAIRKRRRAVMDTVNLLPDELLTSAQVAEYLQMTEEAVRRLARQGHLAGFKIGAGPKGDWRFDAAKVNAMLKAGDLSDLTPLPKRFEQERCHQAGLTLIEARFLHALTLSKRDNRWVITYFGLGLDYHLLQRGLVDNPLGDTGTTHTNLWQLTGEGDKAYSLVTGERVTR